MINALVIVGLVLLLLIVWWPTRCPRQRLGYRCRPDCPCQGGDS